MILAVACGASAVHAEELYRGKTIQQWKAFVMNAKTASEPLGPVAEQVIPALIDALAKDPKSLDRYALPMSDILLVLQCEAFPPAIRELRKKEITPRHGAIFVLLRMGPVHPGPHAKEWVEAALRLTDNKDANARAGALGALKLLDPTAPRVVEAFMKQVGGEHEETIFHCADGLSDQPQPTFWMRQAVCNYIEQTEDGHRAFIRARVISRKGEPALKPNWLIKRYQENLTSDEAWHRHDAVLCLMTLRAADPETVKGLIRRIRDTDEDIPAYAIEALGRTGKAGLAAIPALTEVVRREHRNKAEVAVRAIAELGGPLEILIEALRESHPSVRMATAKALGQMGAAAKPAIPALLAELKTAPIALYAALVAEALGEIDPKRADVAQGLLKALERYDEWLPRATIMAALGKAWAEGRKAIPLMIERAREDGYDKDAAIEALGRFGGVAKDAVPALRRAALHKNPATRVKALRSLWQITHDPDGSVPGLVKLLDPTVWPEYREEAAAVLGEIGPRAKAAKRALKKMSEDGLFRVGQAADAALEKIG